MSQLSSVWMNKSGCTVVTSRAAIAAMALTESFDPATARGFLAISRLARSRAALISVSGVTRRLIMPQECKSSAVYRSPVMMISIILPKNQTSN
jgi:hypothetical protein